MPCEATGNLRYVRRVFANGTVHYCIQNTETLDLVKHPRHDYRPFIRHDEIPVGEPVHQWIEPTRQRGLFNE